MTWQDVFKKAMADEPAEEITLFLYDACIAAGLCIRTDALDAALVHLDRAVDAYEAMAVDESEPIA